jgi:pimeloyl-ACP methyl ester carboxylesterase
MSTDKGRFVTSSDGTKIWAQAAGNPSKPAVVFIHGFTCTGLHFSKQFSDPELLENLYLVYTPRQSHDDGGCERSSHRDALKGHLG